MPRPVDTARRQDLLARALPYLAEHGLAGLSLKPLAAALGTSDRMLVHYFGTKEKLVGLVLAAARPDVPALLAAHDDHGPPGDPRPRSVTDVAHRLWADLCDDGPQQPRVRLLLEVMALAMTQPDAYGPFAAAAVEDWVVPIAAALTARRQLTAGEARARATMLVSGLRGLALDRYITGDAARTDAAAALLIDHATPPDES